MPTGDIPNPEDMIWTDACGWVSSHPVRGIMDIVLSPRQVDRDHVRRDAIQYARDLLAATNDDDFAAALRGLGYCAREWS